MEHHWLYKTIVTIILGCIFVYCMHEANAQEWSTSDVQREVAYDSLVVMDNLLTKNMLAKGHSESGLLLSSNPSNKKLNQMALGNIVLHCLISDNIEQRKLFQNVSIAVIGAVNVRAISLGARIDF